jgi:uncharacterized protein (DUF58 family)
MIAPRTNLVAWAAAIILPLSILAGVVGNLRYICVLGIVIFVLVSLADLLRGLGKYRQLEWQLPAVNRVTAGRKFELGLKLNGTALRGGAIRVAVDLPPAIKSDQSSVALQIKGDLTNLLVPIKAVTEQRGSYPIRRLFFDWVSPARFWIFRQEYPLVSELRVYPDLALEGRKIAHFLDRGGFGVHRQRQIGRGREFEKLREYEPGDSFDSIHWKAAAKRQKPITKVFQVEKSQEVYLTIDSPGLWERRERRAPGTLNDKRQTPNATRRPSSSASSQPLSSPVPPLNDKATCLASLLSATKSIKWLELAAVLSTSIIAAIY